MASHGQIMSIWMEGPFEAPPPPPSRTKISLHVDQKDPWTAAPQRRVCSNQSAAWRLTGSQIRALVL